MQKDYILIDRSGSMANKWSDTLGGVNAYVEQLAKDSATSGIEITCAVFDTVGPFDVVRTSVAASAWPKLTDRDAAPRGGTPLYDAVARLVALADKDAPEKSAIVIVTDGFENSSREVNREQAKALLDRCRTKNWQVIFLGADFDNAQQASDLGNFSGATMSVKAANLAGTMRATASLRAGYYSTGAAMAYSAEDRKRAGK